MPAKRRDIDWMTIREEYVTGDIGYRALADKHGIRRTTLANVAKKEEWTTLRERYRRKLRTDTLDKAASKITSERAKKIVKLQKAADGLADAITKAFEDAQQFNRHIVTISKGAGFDTEERVYKKIDTKAIKNLTSALKDLTQVVRNVYDLPTIQEQQAMDIAGRRLQLEEKKAEEDDGGNAVVVTFQGGDAEEWSG